MQTIRPYYASRFFSEFILVYPFYLLIFQERGLSVASSGWLMAIWSFSVMAFEIPAGMVSDKANRKHVLIAAVIVKALAFLLWIPNWGFISAASGFVLWGLSESLNSGTEEAWLYETLASEGSTEHYTRIRGKGQFFASMGIALAAPAGGWLSRYGMHAVLIASAFSCMVAGIAMLRFENPPRTHTHLPDQGDEAAPIRAGDLRKVWNAWRSHSLIIHMTLFSCLILIVAGVLDEWDPLLLHSLGISNTMIGVWITIRFTSESLGAMLSHRADSILGSPRKMAIAAAGFALPLLTLGYFFNLAWLPAYCLFYFGYAMIAVQLETRIQESTPGDWRASVLSLRSLLDNASGIGLILISGYAIQIWGYSLVWIIAGTYAIVGSSGFLFFNRT